MGLFDLFTTKSEKTEDEVDLAEKLFDTLTVGTSQNPSRKVKALLKECDSRNDVLNKCLDLTEGHNTPKARYVRAMAYSWSKASLRPAAIESIEDYLNNDLYDGAYLYKRHLHLHGVKPTIEREKDIHIANMYTALGKAYEGEYEFEKALNAYTNAYNLVPEWAHHVLSMAQIYMKMNDLPRSIKILQEYKRTEWYKPCKLTSSIGKVTKDSTNKRVIDNNLAEYKEKKQAGYVYKSRKKK